MKINAETALSSPEDDDNNKHPKILLVPYTSQHVPTYHAWMQSPELRELTASEPLTLEEELEMQRKWREDGDKLTFIICAAKEGGAGGRRMVGDVNCFLFEDEDDEGVVGELELMIAEPGYRRKGIGRKALRVFMGYIHRHWEEIAAEFASSSSSVTQRRLSYLRVKINQENTGSIRLFEGLGFEKVGDGKANFFGEVELRRKEIGTREGEKFVEGGFEECMAGIPE